MPTRAVGWLNTITDRLLGRSAYQAPPAMTGQLELDSAEVERIRRSMGGQLSPLPHSQTRWYLADVEAAEHACDSGMIADAARLMRAARSDGTLAGVLSTRTAGLVRLPRRFTGDPDVVADLEVGHDDIVSVFDEMLPASELAQLAADGVLLGIGVGELVPVAGRDYPVLVRLEPEFLNYRWQENRWFYQSIAGNLPITPGDGRWVLHVPGGRSSPWQNGQWRAVGKAYVRKTHAQLYKDAWEAKLANPARAAVSPQGAAESQTLAWFRAVMAWGVNTVFNVPPGYDVKLIESNGRGWESFDTTIKNADRDSILAIAGQTVTTDGGAGFQNSDIHKTIRSDLIKETADTLALTLNTQAIPVFVALRYGPEAVTTRPCVVSWDASPPKDRTAEATTLSSVATAITTLTEALHAHGIGLDVATLCTRFNVPIAGDADGDGQVDAVGTLGEVVEVEVEGEVVEVEGDADVPVPAPVPALAPSNDADADADADSGADDPEAELDESQVDKAADTALNGAQVSSLLEVVQKVVDGQLPRDSAQKIIEIAFNLPPEQADAILGDVGASFEPASDPDEPAPDEPAPDAPDELDTLDTLDSEAAE